MGAPFRLYTIIAFASFLILAAVQFFLVYNTYRLKDEQHYFEEKNTINSLYRQSILNDKIYPGGQTIIDKYLVDNMPTLDSAWKTDTVAFRKIAQSLTDSILFELKANSNIDSLMNQILGEIDYDGSLEWLSLLEDIAITFDGKQYIRLFYLDEVSSEKLKQQNYQSVIAGNLKDPNKNSLATAITVSSPHAYSNRISFSLYADSPYRTLMVLKKMWPVLLLALFSIFCVAAIFYFTFRNWVKQKKLAEMKSDFVNSITHEFNTPLSSIIVANKGLQNERIYQDREKMLSLTSVIGRQSQRLKTLFEQVLDLTMMNASTLQKEEVVLEDLIEEIVADYRLLNQNKMVSIEYVKKQPGHTVLLNKFWVTTMIINLLDNGIKYNNNVYKTLKISIEESGRQLNLSISDNGVGIPPEIASQIFEKFYRNTGNMESNATNGLGLGLFYVRKCVSAHEWDISFQSKEKAGTEFTISIPMD